MPWIPWPLHRRGCPLGARLPGSGRDPVSRLLWLDPGEKGAFARLAAELGTYPVVILGSGDEWRSGGDLGATKRLIRVDRASRFYGSPRAAGSRRLEAHWRGGCACGLRRSRLWGFANPLGQDRETRSCVRIPPSGERVGSSGSGGRGAPQDQRVACGELGGGPGKTISDHRGKPRRIARARTGGHTRLDDRNRKSSVQWVATTLSRVNGAAIAVAGPDYSSRSNVVVPVAWIRQAVLATQGAEATDRRGRRHRLSGGMPP